MRYPPRVKQLAADYAESSQGEFDLYECSATLTLTLLSPAKRRRVFVVNTGTGAVTIATAGDSATINGAATQVISNQYDGVEMVANGLSGSSAAWRIAGAFTASEAVLASGKIVVGNASNVPVAVTPAGDVTIDNAGATAIGAGKVTPAMTSQAVTVAVTADGLTTGIVPVTARHVTVTSDDANKILTLPASVVGKVLTIRNGATGYEIRTTAASSIKINDVVSGSTNECAIPATALVTAVCVSTTEWVLTAVDKLGAAIAALVPDAV